MANDKEDNQIFPLFWFMDPIPLLDRMNNLNKEALVAIIKELSSYNKKCLDSGVVMEAERDLCATNIEDIIKAPGSTI